MRKRMSKEYNKYILDIDNYGEYRHGLTSEEVNKYLRVRSKGTKYSRYSIKQLQTKFKRVAGINTGVVVTCPICKKFITLMYRYDVKRFVDQMLQGIFTSWD